MKRIIILWGIAVIILLSCSKETTTTPNSFSNTNSPTTNTLYGMATFTYSVDGQQYTITKGLKGSDFHRFFVSNEQLFAVLGFGDYQFKANTNNNSGRLSILIPIQDSMVHSDIQVNKKYDIASYSDVTDGNEFTFYEYPFAINYCIFHDDLISYYSVNHTAIYTTGHNFKNIVTSINFLKMYTGKLMLDDAKDSINAEWNFYTIKGTFSDTTDIYKYNNLTSSFVYTDSTKIVSGMYSIDFPTVKKLL